MRDPQQMLENMYETYLFRADPKSGYKLKKTDKLRWLGGMEVLLMCVGAIIGGVAIQYQKKTVKFFFIPFKVEESYEDYILRNTYEFLMKRAAGIYLL